MDHEAEQVNAVALEILSSAFVRLHTDRLELKEDFELNQASIIAQIRQRIGDEEKKLELTGKGVGLIDAYFDALLSSYAKEYVSLSTVSIVDFNISIKTTGSKGSHTDAMAIAVLRVKNADKHEYTFTHKSASISQSSIGAVQDVLQFFINSERAYTQLYIALEDAKKRSRSDLIQKYQLQMSTLVRATSYKEIVERLKGGQ
ncbi:MAG: alpha-isopropylmalate synthase regulatory domain-containing protein [Myxococcota bacterium]